MPGFLQVEIPRDKNHDALVAALTWYEAQTSGILGNDGLEALEQDQGAKARAALAAAAKE
jgi:hypothetical protein